VSEYGNNMEPAPRPPPPPGPPVTEDTFRGALEAAPDAIVIVDEQGRILLANSQAEVLFGHAREDLLGRPVETLVPERFRHQHPAQREGFLADPRVRPMGAGLDLRARRRDGSEFPVEISLSPLRDQGRSFVVAAIRDVTEQRKAERALRESQERFSGFFEATAMPLAISRAKDGSFLEVNEAFASLVGCAREDLVGKTSMDLGIVDVASRESLQRQLQAQGRVHGAEVEMQARTGERRIVQVAVEPITIGGEPCLALSMADVTPIRKAQEAVRAMNEDLERRVQERTAELERSNAELQQFAYVASHDLQEPLRTVSGAVTRLARRHEDKLDEQGREFVRFALEGTARMQQLIEDLLSVSRVGSRGQELKPVSADAALDRALLGLQASLAESGAQVEREPLPRVLGDESQLAQLFQNLLGNAVKFRGAQPPRIRVSARKEGDHAVVSVVDNGIGIDPKHKERVFVIFQRLDPGKPGTGIGLAIAKKIVERHGGRIWVEPAPGGGSAFSFTLRLAEGSA